MVIKDAAWEKQGQGLVAELSIMRLSENRPQGPPRPQKRITEHSPTRYLWTQETPVCSLCQIPWQTYSVPGSVLSLGSGVFPLGMGANQPRDERTPPPEVGPAGSRVVFGQAEATIRMQSLMEYPSCCTGKEPQDSVLSTCPNPPTPQFWPTLGPRRNH